jgi:hypothetical protein
MEKKKVLDINEFVHLLLATIAQNSRKIMLKDKKRKIASLPFQYKQIIQNILCADNDWREKFSILIDTEEYFENHFAWEQKLALTLKQALIDLNKTFEYDFEYDKLLISFTQEEINMILSQYPNEELKNIMDHFANLLVDYIYTREFQEEHYDYYASTVSKMHNMSNLQINEDMLNNYNEERHKKRIKSLFKQNR